MVRVKRLAYGLFEVRSIARWRDYLHLMYGLSLEPSQATGVLEARVDDSGCRLMFRAGPADDCVAAGWECGDLEGLKAQIEQSGFAAQWGRNRMRLTAVPAVCYEPATRMDWLTKLSMERGRTSHLHQRITGRYTTLDTWVSAT